MLLFRQTNDKQQQRSQAARVSRHLALLHAHGLIAHVSRSYRLQVTPKGRRILGMINQQRLATERRALPIPEFRNPKLAKSEPTTANGNEWEGR